MNDVRGYPTMFCVDCPLRTEDKVIRLETIRPPVPAPSLALLCVLSISRGMASTHLKTNTFINPFIPIQ